MLVISWWYIIILLVQILLSKYLMELVLAVVRRHFFLKDATYKSVAIRDNIPQLNMSLRATANGDKILFYR